MPKSKDSSVQVAIIVVALLAVVGGAWLILNNRESDISDVPVQAVVNPAAPINPFPERQRETMPVDRAMQMAEMAFQSGQLAEPEDGSAMYFYRQVLKQEPENSRALSGLSLIATQLIDEANELLAKDEFDKVVGKLTIINRIEPGSDNVLSIEAALSAKANAMFVSVDQAIKLNQFDNAEQIVKNLQIVPGVDAGRISSARVSIATGRKQWEDGLAAEKAKQAAQTKTKSKDVLANVGSQTDTKNSRASGDPVNAGGGTLNSEQAKIIEPEKVDVTPLIESAKQRFEQNKLVGPANDNAMYFYQQALRQDPTNSGAKLGLRGLVQKLTSTAYNAAKAGKWETAEAAMTDAEKAGIAENLIVEGRADLKKLRFQEEAKKVRNISEFTVENTVPPKYPRRAISRSVEGWVTVAFTVSESGTTKDLKVVESSRKFSSQFAKSAMTAVEQWKFKPHMFEGQAIAQRSQTTVQFKLTE